MLKNGQLLIGIKKVKFLKSNLPINSKKIVCISELVRLVAMARF